MNVNTLRKLDRKVGIAVIGLISLLRPRREPPKQVCRILVIKLFGFGNFIFLSPTIRRLKLLFPDANIDVLTFTQNREICEMYSDINQVHSLRFSTWLPFDLISFITKSFRRYDLAIDFEQFARLSAIIGLLCWPRYFAGIPTKNSMKERAFDTFVHYLEQKHIVVEYYEVAKLLARLYGKTVPAVPATLLAPEITWSIKAEHIAKQFKGKVIGVCMGCRGDDKERRYPEERFAKIVDMLLKLKATVVFFGISSERSGIQSVIDRSLNHKKCFNCAGMSLHDSAPLISRTDVFISNDTGPIHLAAALGVFCVGLYGPSKEWIYGPYTKKKIICRDKHKPVRSNHNEKLGVWPSTWWPKPEEVFKRAKKIIQ